MIRRLIAGFGTLGGPRARRMPIVHIHSRSETPLAAVPRPYGLSGV